MARFPPVRGITNDGRWWHYVWASGRTPCQYYQEVDLEGNLFLVAEYWTGKEWVKWELDG